MAAGDPTGADLCAESFSATALSSSLVDIDDYYTVTFSSPIELSSGIQYAIVVGTANVLSTPGYRIVWEQHTSDGYSGGLKCVSADAGSTWSQSSNRDCYFVTKEGGVTKESFTYFPGQANQYIYGDFWIAQTFTASSTYTLNSVVLGLKKEGSLVAGTITVSIKAVVPAKASSPVPSDAAADVVLGTQTISWSGDAASYNVYYGADADNLQLVSSEQTSKSFTILGVTNGSPFDYAVSRAWRIDSVDAGGGTVVGDVWTFTTISFNAPSAGARGGTGGTGGGTIADGQSNIKTRLVAFARNKVFYEDG